MASNGGVGDGSECGGPFKFGIGEGECGKLIWWIGIGWEAAVVCTIVDAVEGIGYGGARYPGIPNGEGWGANEDPAANGDPRPSMDDKRVAKDPIWRWSP